MNHYLSNRLLKTLFALLTNHIYSNTVQKTFTFTWKRPQLYQNIFKGTELQYFGQRSLCTEGSWGQVASSSWIFKMVAFLSMGNPSLWVFIKAQARGFKTPGFLLLVLKPKMALLIGNFMVAAMSVCFLLGSVWHTSVTTNQTKDLLVRAFNSEGFCLINSF